MWTPLNTTKGFRFLPLAIAASDTVNLHVPLSCPLVWMQTVGSPALVTDTSPGMSNQSGVSSTYPVHGRGCWWSSHILLNVCTWTRFDPHSSHTSIHFVRNWINPLWSSLHYQPNSQHIIAIVLNYLLAWLAAPLSLNLQICCFGCFSTCCFLFVVMSSWNKTDIVWQWNAWSEGQRVAYGSSSQKQESCRGMVSTLYKHMFRLGQHLHPWKKEFISINGNRIEVVALAQPSCSAHFFVVSLSAKLGPW